MNVELKKMLKHVNRKRNKKTANNRKINNKELYYYLSDLPSPDSLSEF
jgi:hypothetical protein